MTDVENAMKVGIAEALKHEVKLVEKLGPIVTLLWRWHVAKGFIRSLEFPFPKLCFARYFSFPFSRGYSSDRTFDTSGRQSCGVDQQAAFSHHLLDVA